MLARPAVLTTVLFLVAPSSAQETQPAHDEARWFRNVRQVTSRAMGLDRSGEAYFSPDGKRISFQAYPAGQSEYQIYVLNLDGSGLKLISTGKGATTCSFWHPGGEKLIFAANHHDPRHAPGAESAPESTTAPAGREAATQPATGGHPGKAGAEHPAKPTAPTGHGSRSYAWEYFPGMDIYEYTLATEKLRRLTFADGYDAECAYSPDGKSIVFSSLRTGAQEIFICDAEGKNERQITHAGGKNGGPFFSPDGKRLCYRSDRDGSDNLQIFINNTEGTAERALTGNDVLNWCPFWHPSGKWLIFTRADHRGRPNYDLYLIRDDGSETHRVTSDAAFDGLPVFSAEGKLLMWTSRRDGLDSPQVFVADFLGLTPSGELVAP